MKKTISFFSKNALLSLLVFSGIGSAEILPTIAEDTTTIWSASFLEKIKRDDTYNPALYGSASLSLDVTRAEGEVGQLILTPKEDANYDIQLSDLTLDGQPSVTYPASQVNVYTALYVNVGNLYNGRTRGMTTGYYPDTMLPWEAAKRSGVNRLYAGKNQSVYFDFQIPLHQTPGLYHGTYQVTVSGFTYDIPVTLKVRDLTVSPAVTSLSLFLDDWTYYLGEYEGTQRMLDLYHQALMDYRLCPSKLVTDTSYTQEDAAYYAEKVAELYHEGRDESRYGEGADRFTNYCVPVSPASESVFANQLNLYLGEIAKVSCREGVNLLDRARLYFIDEPEGNRAYDYTRTMSAWYESAKLAVSSAIEQSRAFYKTTYGVNDSFVTAMVDSVKNLHNIITQSYMEKYEEYVETWCPLFDSYDTPSNVAKYQEDNPDERWWYGCVIPMTPYPTYHIDDLGFSPRIVGWLQALYGVKGNLYWAVDSYAPYSNILSEGGYAYRFPEEYYDDASIYDICNGEGYLFRPGKKYGVDGPIPTARITSIRDGLEEYELLENLKTIYRSTSESIGITCDAESNIRDLLSALASGMQIGGTVADFEAARQSLLDLCEFTKSGAVFSQYQDDGSGHVSYDLFVPSDVSIKVEGAEESGVNAVTGGSIHHYTVDLSSSSASAVVFTVTKDGQTVSLTRRLAGKVTVYDVSEATKQELSGDVETNSSLRQEDGRTLLPLHLKEVGASETRRYQRVYFKPSYLSEWNEKTTRALFKFYFEPAKESDTLKLRLCVKYKNKLSVEEVYSGNLTNGYNEITVSQSRLNWSNGAIERIDFRFDDAATGSVIAARDDVSFAGVSLYQ